jgi:hypothetical protein
MPNLVKALLAMYLVIIALFAIEDREDKNHQEE